MLRDSNARIESGLSDALIEDVRATLYERLGLELTNVRAYSSATFDAVVEIIVTQLRANGISEAVIRGSLTGPAAAQHNQVRTSTPVLINCPSCRFTHISSKECVDG